MKLEELKKKKVLILGFGREGMDSFKFLRRLLPKKVLGVAAQLELEKLEKKARTIIQNEKRSRLIKLYLGKNYLKALQNYDIIIKSPGIPFKILPRNVLGRITTQTEIFFDNCPGKIVGVTGTKGKSTTVSLIYKILKEGGVKVRLVGNIGKPVLNLLFSATPKNAYVYELSSHQLYNLKKSPRIAVVLNIYPEHLDYYKNLKEYINAKANITRYQTKNDYLIYNSGNKIVREIAKKSQARKISFNSKMPFEFLSTWRKSQIGKSFNFLNIAAAVEVARIFKIPKEKIKKAIENFKPLPHRLEYVGTFKGIKFYNDALSTIPETTMAALDILGNKVETIFLGGFDRGLDFKKLTQRVLKDKIKNLILFPTTGEKIWREIVRQVKNDFSKLPRAFLVQNMKDAVKLAYEHTQRGKICLLSCASSSFSIFRDYKEKGNLFKKYVKRFARNPALFKKGRGVRKYGKK